MYKLFIKRIIDVLVAFTGLLLLSPLFFTILIILLFSNNGKPFFFQKRPGKNEKIYSIIKFKTMNDKKDSAGNLLPNFERITKIGSFIRKTSLDEIPQLINVLIGDMSIIGPRPLLVAYLPLSNQTQKKRHLVKPGISGWAQVNGRNAIKWKRKFELDVWYVENISFLLDCKIIWLTVLKVLKAEGVSASEQVTMERFTGSDDD